MVLENVESKSKYGCLKMPCPVTPDVRGVAIHPDFPGYIVLGDGRVMKLGGRKLKGCITPKGYRVFFLRHRDGKPRKVRGGRLVCWAFHGTPPTPSHEAAHRDHDRANDHVLNVRWLTHAENEGEKAVSGRSAKVLTPEDVKAIRAVAALGEQTQGQIAKAFGVSRRTISFVVTGKRWVHV